MCDLLLGIVGSGGRGMSLGAAIHAPNRGARVVACCDTDPAALARNRRLYGPDIFVTWNYRELLARDLDAVIVSTPDFLHEEHATAALACGLPVFIEKPMAISIEGCDRLLRQAVRSKARLFIGHNLRHMPFVRKMKELVDDGAIGEVKACWARHFVGHGGDYYFRDWHAERQYTHGLLLQKAVHDIDIIHWLCGGYSRVVSAMGDLTLYGSVRDRLPATRGPRRLERPQVRMEIWPPAAQRRLNHRIDIEDLSQVQMRLDNGVLAQYSQCHYTPDYWRSYVVIGTEGRMENFGNIERGTSVRLWNKRRRGYHARGDKVFNIPPQSGSHGGADVTIMAEFLRFLREGGPTASSPIAARESVAAGYMATNSLRAGGVPLRVPAVASKLVRAVERLGLDRAHNRVRTTEDAQALAV